MRRNLILNAAIAACLAKKFSTESQPMTTTTPTTAQECNDKLADLDLLTNALRECANALAYAAFNIDGKTLDDLDPRLLESTGVSDSCLIAARTARAALAEAKRAALARRAAQPVTPVQDVLTIPTAIMNIPCTATMSHFPTRHEMAAYKQGHRDGRHAAADLVLARADELKALATPSPQIAEVAELPQPWQERMQAAHPTSEAQYWPDSLKCKYMSLEIDDLRDAIAASRRAAGGEVAAPAELTAEIVALLVCTGLNRPQAESAADKLTWLFRRYPAPASAGQATPALPDVAMTEMDEAAEIRRYNEWAWKGGAGMPIGMMYPNDAGRVAWIARARIAAQPAEGAAAPAEQTSAQKGGA